MSVAMYSASVRCIIDSVRYECEVCELQCTVRMCGLSVIVYSARAIRVSDNVQCEVGVCQ